MLATTRGVGNETYSKQIWRDARLVPRRGAIGARLSEAPGAGRAGAHFALPNRDQIKCMKRELASDISRRII